MNKTNGPTRDDVRAVDDTYDHDFDGEMRPPRFPERPSSEKTYIGDLHDALDNLSTLAGDLDRLSRAFAVTGNNEMKVELRGYVDICNYVHRRVLSLTCEDLSRTVETAEKNTGALLKAVLIGAIHKPDEKK